MGTSIDQQIVISGVGGQGVLFVTRLLAEAAVNKGFPVLTSETHGMAQRGGVVLSHLKVGEYSSPLIRPSMADGLLTLKSETLSHHAFYLKPNGWTVINQKGDTVSNIVSRTFHLDADRLALKENMPRSVNLILLGFAMAGLAAGKKNEGLFCSVEDIETVLTDRIGKNKPMRDASLNAFRLGAAAFQGRIPRIDAHHRSVS